MINIGHCPIGIFDSGYGGLTIMQEIVTTLPEYDYLYLGDNARTPYGTRSFEAVYNFTLQGVKKLFDNGCHLVIIACNTASAKALRTIQQKDLPKIDPSRRVLGVIRPTTEVIGKYSQTKHIGILGTTGTVNSNSYPIEINKFFPEVKVFQQSCPLLVPLIENNEHNSPGADYFIQKYFHELMNSSNNIDTIVLACTHYPIIFNQIKSHIKNKKIQLINQNKIIASSLIDYLNRHPEMKSKCSKQEKRHFYTTDSSELFNKQGTIFYGQPIKSEQISI